MTAEDWVTRDAPDFEWRPGQAREQYVSDVDARLAARKRILATRLADQKARQREREAMPHDPDRPQSGYFDAHPPRDAYKPAHGVCEPRQSPESTPDGESATDAENGPRTAA